MAAAGKERAFTEFVDARSTALLRVSYLLVGDRGLAEDLLQTALAKCYVSWGRLREPAAAEAYARKVLVTTAVTWWRRKGWHERPSGDVAALLSATAGPQLDVQGLVTERDRVWAGVLRLSPQQRAVVVLRFYEDLPEAQIAELLGCARGTVKVHSSRALAALRPLLSAESCATTEEGL